MGIVGIRKGLLRKKAIIRGSGCIYEAERVTVGVVAETSKG